MKADIAIIKSYTDPLFGQVQLFGFQIWFDLRQFRRWRAHDHEGNHEPDSNSRARDRILAG